MREFNQKRGGENPQCPTCGRRTMSVMVRGMINQNKIFETLEERKYCPECDKIFTIKFSEGEE